MKNLFFFFSLFLFAVNVMATNPTEGLNTNSLEVSMQAEEGMSLRFYNQIQTSGHIEFVARVIADDYDLEPQGPYTYSWSIEGYPDSATMYIWPRGAGQGSVADVSIYYTSSGAANIKCVVYKNGTYLKTLSGFVSF